MEKNWTEQDEKNLGDLCCLMNLWQDGKNYTLTPKRSCEMREWLHDKFPDAERWSRPRAPIELMSWEEFQECKKRMFDENE